MPDIWASKFGTQAVGDVTLAFQASINAIAAQPNGGTLHIESGTYLIGYHLGNAKWGNPRAGAAQTYQAYCLKLPNNVCLKAEAGVVFRGPYVYGAADSSQLACICCDQFANVLNIGIENITFTNYFVGIGIFQPQTTGLSTFVGNTFNSCAIGFYSRGFERSIIDRTFAAGTGCVIAVGGQWATSANTISELGGFSDKTNYGTLNNNYTRTIGAAEAAIDSYFDTVVFQTNAIDLSLAKAFPYRGLCGRAIYIMSRHARPSNSNVFDLVSHAFAPRGALWVDNAGGNVARAVYLENVGWQNPNNPPSGQIGVSYPDPWCSGAVPKFVLGVSCPIFAYQAAGVMLCPKNEYSDISYSCTLSQPQPDKIFLQPLQVPQIISS